jgi:hypothetical protein
MPEDGRDGPFGRGLVLGVSWFPVVVRRLNIAGNGHSTGLAAIGRLTRG